MELVDTHCHLHFDNYDNDRDEVLKASARAGVNRIICVGCSLTDSERATAFAASHPGVWATVGAHPHDGADFITDAAAGQRLTRLMDKPKVVAVGEIGLDYYHRKTSKADQEKILRVQLEIGLEHGLPFVFHVREAWDDFLRVFDSYKGIKGLIHSFSAGPDRLTQVQERGLLVALNGLMTYTKDESWLAAAKMVPRDVLLLETDAPFLTPAPNRSKRCEPKNVVDTCRFLAELRGESPEDLASITTKNAVAFFGLNDERIS